jgi:hypothetical protein
MVSINELSNFSRTSDFRVYEDRAGGIVVIDRAGKQERFTSRRKCLRFLMGITKAKVSQYVLAAIKDDLQSLGDTKGLVYDPNK